MMENTLDNKRLFFTQYWGQFRIFNERLSYHTAPVGIVEVEAIKDSYLLLRDLKNITDEDAYGVGIRVNCWSWRERKMDFFKDGDLEDVHIKGGRNFAACIGKEYGPGISHPFANNSTDILHAYDFLRSKGYAMPFMGVNVQELVKWGWVKLK